MVDVPVDPITRLTILQEITERELTRLNNGLAEITRKLYGDGDFGGGVYGQLQHIRHQLDDFRKQLDDSKQRFAAATQQMEAVAKGAAERSENIALEDTRGRWQLRATMVVAGLGFLGVFLPKLLELVWK